MKVTAIIAEYNPFHNGHQYQIRMAQQLTGADYVAIVMSGNFVQRGSPAVMDKFARAKMALLGGADLVLELPARYACGSAEYFAGGAVSLLDGMGCVDHLSFGCEHADLPLLEAVASVLAAEPEAYRQTLFAALREGKPFPAAREEALWASLSAEVLQYLAKASASAPEAAGNVAPEPQSGAKDILHALLSRPNNILALEYLKALKKSGSAIKPAAVQRVGCDYHSPGLSGTYSSATALRKALGIAQAPEAEDTAAEGIRAAVPADVFSVLTECLGSSCPVFPEDFSSMLAYRLLRAKGWEEFAACFDVSEDLARRIFALRGQFSGFEQFVSLVKTRNLTEGHVCRALLHILLGLPADALPCGSRSEKTGGKFANYYLRILGFRRSAAPLLRAVKENGRLPLISKPADARQLFSDYEKFSPADTAAANAFLDTELDAAAVYAAAVSCKFHSAAINEFQTPVMIP